MKEIATGLVETASPRIIPQNIPQNIPPVPTSTSSDLSNIRGLDTGSHGIGYPMG